MSEERMIKVVLDEGKEVVLREPKISHSELAAQRSSSDGADVSKNPAHFAMVQQRHTLMACLVSVNGEKDIKKPVDELFTVAEYNDLIKVVSQLGGNEGKRKKPVISFV